MVNEGIFATGGTVRRVPVTIGGTSYVPPLPIEADVKDAISDILAAKEPVVNKAIKLCLYCMKTQVFIDGNKRASIIFANHYMIKQGEGLLVVPESKVDEFKSLLVSYYEGKNEKKIFKFFRDECWRKF